MTDIKNLGLTVRDVEKEERASAAATLEALKSLVYAYGANNAEPVELQKALYALMAKATAAIDLAEGRAPRRNIGGSILPSTPPERERHIEGVHGVFEVRPLPELDTHGLFYARKNGEHAGTFMLIAMHPNGHSCKVLGQRIAASWQFPNSGTREHAMAQFDYLLACGGMGMSRTAMELIVAGTW